MLGALQRRAEYHAELDSMTPEQRAEHDVGVDELKSLFGKPAVSEQPSPVSVPDEVTAEDCPAFVKYDVTDVDEAWSRGFNACRAAMQLFGNSEQLKAEPVTGYFRENGNSSTENFREIGETSTKCWCRTCRPVTLDDMRFVICPVCGNKRCPHANDHRNPCTGSNEPGQPGSAYPDIPNPPVPKA